MRIGVPRGIVEVLGLTVVVEERAQSRYMAHAALPNVDPDTLEVLKGVTEDETWHLSWIEKKMREIAREEGSEGKPDEILKRYRDIDREVYVTLAADEAALLRAERGLAITADELSRVTRSVASFFGFGDTSR